MTKPFEFVAPSDLQRAKHRSNGHWACASCHEVAEIDRDGEECHRCRDWSGCGTDCRATRAYCRSCGTEMKL